MGHSVNVFLEHLLDTVPEFWSLIDKVDSMVNNIIVVLE